MDYLPDLWTGLVTTLELTTLSLTIGLTLALLFTCVLVLPLRAFAPVVNAYILLFTGTPLLVQFFLIYYGPGQFESIIESPLWVVLKQPYWCAVITLALNTAAYSTLLFKGAVEAIDKGQWQACRALGMNAFVTLRVLLPLAFRRVLPAYSNEVILVLKGTSLASTITILELMGQAQRINALTYDSLTVFGLAGVMYLTINGLLTVLFKQLEKRALAFER